MRVKIALLKGSGERGGEREGEKDQLRLST